LKRVSADNSLCLTVWMHHPAEARWLGFPSPHGTTIEGWWSLDQWLT